MSIRSGRPSLASSPPTPLKPAASTSVAVSTRFAGFGDDAGLDLPALSQRTEAEVVARLLSRDFEDWSEAAARVGHCAHPIRLRGSSTTFDKTTGDPISSYATTSEPFGVLHVRCGNRRASECPSCSRVYAADTFHLIRAGVVGGKGVPEHVGDNPLVFATLTAPSFGPVHGTRGISRGSGGKSGGRCRPFTRRGSAGSSARCAHDRSMVCRMVHDQEDAQLGQPLCWECYDYAGQVVWQWWAPELWRRFTIALRRDLAHRLGVTDTQLHTVATVQYAKVAEYQKRGLIHFHALIRLDGARTDTGFAPAHARVSAEVLAAAVKSAAASTYFTAPPVYAGDDERLLGFGAQVDTRIVTTGDRTDDPDRELTAGQVAGYLAKYATKSATDSCPDQGNGHLARLRSVLTEFAALVEDDAGLVDRVGLADLPYGLLWKWTHMLGFRGHFSTKSRRYSVTLGQLRRARRRFHAKVTEAARTGIPFDVHDLDDLLDQDDDDTTLVIGEWAYAGSGWDTTGDAELAKAAAARAREYAQHQAQSKRVQ